MMDLAKSETFGNFTILDKALLLCVWKAVVLF